MKSLFFGYFLSLTFFSTSKSSLGWIYSSAYTFYELAAVPFSAISKFSTSREMELDNFIEDLLSIMTADS